MGGCRGSVGLVFCIWDLAFEFGCLMWMNHLRIFAQLVTNHASKHPYKKWSCGSSLSRFWLDIGHWGLSAAVNRLLKPKRKCLSPQHITHSSDADKNGDWTFFTVGKYLSSSFELPNLHIFTKSVWNSFESNEFNECLAFQTGQPFNTGIVGLDGQPLWHLATCQLRLVSTGWPFTTRGGSFQKSAGFCRFFCGFIWQETIWTKGNTEVKYGFCVCFLEL